MITIMSRRVRMSSLVKKGVKKKMMIMVMMRDTHRGDGDDSALLSLSICARDQISLELYDLATRMNKLGSFSANIFVRSRMKNYRKFRMT